MNKETRLEGLKEYIVWTKRILEISSPQLSEVANAEGYRLYLQHSFQEIGALGRRNIQILEEYLFPLMTDGVKPTVEDIESLRVFSTLLVDTTSMENLDLPLIYMQAEKILENAERDGNLRAQIVAMDGFVVAAYMMVNLTIRLYPEIDECYQYRDAGLRAALKLHEFLEPEKFKALPDDECRELVLINARYMRCLFEWDDKIDRAKYNAEDLRLMRQALALADDPFYRELMPNYRWDSHIFRTLQYIADFTEYNNKHNFNDEQLKEINEYTKQLIAFLKKHPDLEEGCPKVEQAFYANRNAYLAGERSLEEYRAKLLEIIAQKDTADFSARSMFIYFAAPYEYILSLDKDALTEEQQEMIRRTYEDIVAYAYHMPKTGVLSFMLTFLSDYLRHYIKVPGGMDFDEMCLKIMAAMHPPTYVHTLNVADITRYLSEQLLARKPELFVGIVGTEDVAQVQAKKNEILEFIYRGTLLHDVGKLFIVETIITYGRKLIDSERDIIQAHTIMGAALLSRFPETQPYAEIAIGHHRYFDNSQGYPETFDLDSAKYKTILSVLEVADSLDAATDSIGRSYKEGKTLDECVEELHEGNGTRYAPYVVELIEDAQVRAELQRLLTEGRDENYRKTYHLLKTL